MVTLTGKTIEMRFISFPSQSGRIAVQKQVSREKSWFQWLFRYRRPSSSYRGRNGAHRDGGKKSMNYLSHSTTAHQPSSISISTNSSGRRNTFMYSFCFNVVWGRRFLLVFQIECPDWGQPINQEKETTARMQWNLPSDFSVVFEDNRIFPPWFENSSFQDFEQWL